MKLSSYLLCINCNKEIHQGIFNNDFASIGTRLCLILLFLIPLLLFYRRSLHPSNTQSERRGKTAPVIIFSLTIGIGMGGFIDGILLHQLLQWHEMISNKLAPTTYVNKSINMFWDGIFEAITWIFTMGGVIMMWIAMKRKDLNLSNYLFVGGLISGWGLFNFLDSVFNHYLFRFHNVKEFSSNKDVWNLGFLILSIVLIVIGGLIIRSKKESATTSKL